LRVSDAGIALIKKFEGLRLAPYLCPAGVATIGYGSTFYPWGVKVKITDEPITEQQANDLLLNSVRKFAIDVEKLLTFPVTQNQFDALVSLAYNIGIKALEGSTLLRCFNEGDFIMAEKQFARWVYVKGSINKGLMERRKQEAELFCRI
jgi:lysozyme